MKKYAIIGYPLGHSISPFIHTSLFSLSGHEADYELIEVSPEELDSRIAKLKQYDGLNVTIPHKTAMIKHMDCIDEFSLMATSMNVGENTKSGWNGYNTDIYGFTESILDAGVSLDNIKSCLLLGCGGSGRMVLFCMAQHNIKTTVAVKDIDDNSLLAISADLNKHYPNFKFEFVSISQIDGDFDLCVNTTPVGMFPHIDDMPIGEDVISKCKFVFDIVYNPEQTALVKTALKLGNGAANALSMLIYQAVKAHEIWYGAKFEKNQIDDLIAQCRLKLHEF